MAAEKKHLRNTPGAGDLPSLQARLPRTAAQHQRIPIPSCGILLRMGGGVLRCGPALMLLQYAHEVNTKLVWDWANLAMLAAPLGTGALVGKGAGTAGALAWFDRAAITLGVVFAVLDDHRGWIIEKFGAQGEAFLRYADVVQSAVALYGLARIATVVPALFRALGAEYQRLQQAMRSAGEALSAEERQGLQEIDGEMQKLLGEVEALRNEGGAEIIPIESARRLREKPPAAEPMPAIQEEPLRATGTDGRLVPISEDSASTRLVASTGKGGPKKPVAAAPLASQSTRSTSAGRAPWRGAPPSSGEVEVAAALIRRGIQEMQARRVARLAVEKRVLDKVEALVKNPGYRNPEDLKGFLEKWNSINEGKIQALEDTATRLQKGHEVALEGGGADVVDYTSREAIQHKRIFGEAPGALREDLETAAEQLRGIHGESPPDGFTRTIDVRFDQRSKNPMRQADKNMLRKNFPGRNQLEQVDRVRITTDKGSFEFAPPLSALMSSYAG